MMFWPSSLHPDALDKRNALSVNISSDQSSAMANAGSFRNDAQKFVAPTIKSWRQNMPSPSSPL
jgi:hypothetical protein